MPLKNDLPFLPLSMIFLNVKFPGGRIDCTPLLLDTASHTPFWIPLIASIVFSSSADDFCNVNVNENDIYIYIYIYICIYVRINLYKLAQIKI